MTGTLVGIDGTTLVVETAQGEKRFETAASHQDDEGNEVCCCKVTLDGQCCCLTDLQAGDKVEVDGRPAVAVKAKRPKPVQLPVSKRQRHQAAAEADKPTHGKKH